MEAEEMTAKEYTDNVPEEEVVALRDKHGAGIPIDDTGRCSMCGHKMMLEELIAYGRKVDRDD